ncbi:MAG: fibronectin type III domain-containing protein [Candidatus Aminicenantes bacterium]|nr:fibronectin type III domain-containing protein [Candidatus Aminicenantes bacterium]
MKHLKAIYFIMVLAFFLLVPAVQWAQMLDVPELTQEQDQWCWAGSSQCVLIYYGNNFQQCEIAEYTRLHSTFHDFGPVNCCVDPTQGCNYWNYNYDPDEGSIKMILIDMPVTLGNPSITNTGVARILTEAEVAAEIGAGRPFVIRICCGGHFIVGRGYQNGNLYYMDPWMGEGFGYDPYGSSLNGRTWTHTNIISLNPGPSCSIPQDLNVVNITEAAATLTWGAVTLASSYEYRYKATSSGTWTTSTTSANSVGITGLSAATEYEFQVKSLCPGGASSDYSASFIFNTDGCDTPTGLAASNIADYSATVSWNAIPEATGYELNYKKASDANWTIVTTSATSVNLTGLEKATTYNNRVKSVCSGIGNSGWSTTVNFKTTGEPTYCASSGGSGSYLDRVQVGPLDNASGAAAYSDFTQTLPAVNLSPGSVSYTLHTGAGTNYFMLWIDFNADGTFSTDERLVSYGLHYQTSGTFTIPNISVTTRMRVSAKANNSQTGPCEVFSSGEVEDYKVIIGGTPPSCDVPGSLSTSGITDTAATLNWGAVTYATGYNVRYKATSSGTWIDSAGTSTSKAISGLTASTQYEWQVQTVCASGTSAYTSSTTFTTGAPSCNVPGSLSTSSITETSATLNWGAVTNAISYDVRYKATSSGTWIDTAGAATSKAISGLTGSTQYEWQVRTVCAAGTSAYTTSTTFTTSAPPDTTTPTPNPMTWASVPAATSSTAISMTASTASDPSGVEYYFECTAGGGHSSSWQSSATYQDTGLTPSTQYTYRVKARDTSANHNETGWSASQSATTQAGGSQYCQSYGQNSATYISKVTFGGFSNTSGAAGYTDFTNKTVNMSAGGSVSYRIDKGDSNTSMFKVWIDYNKDGDFTDSGEAVVSKGLYNSYVTGSFTVPTGKNGTTRMRVSVKRNSSQTSCEIFSYGEVEDYTVVIQ